jgi:hypothetical protein
MSWRARALLGAVLGTSLVAAAHWSNIPTTRSPAMQENCSDCHAGSAPRTHTRKFVDHEHGPVARVNREDCLGCHENTEVSCDGCHREQSPKWHTEDFRNPALGTLEMREHIRIARNYRDSCRECHATMYMTRCAECHRPDEDWLGRGGYAQPFLETPDRALKGIH